MNELADLIQFLQWLPVRSESIRLRTMQRGHCNCCRIALKFADPEKASDARGYVFVNDLFAFFVQNYLNKTSLSIFSGFNALNSKFWYFLERVGLYSDLVQTSLFSASLPSFWCIMSIWNLSIIVWDLLLERSGKNGQSSEDSKRKVDFGFHSKSRLANLEGQVLRVL